MKLEDFHYDLPSELIAQHPLARRADSRMLCLPRAEGPPEDRRFEDLPGQLKPGDLLVFNDTRVIPARLHARKETGGRVEVLVERVLGEGECLAQLRASKTPKAAARLLLEGGAELEVTGREGDFFRLAVASGAASLMDLLREQGHMPLPPYIQREDEAADRDRYQTVYAERPGAVAAPTAGLHFDRAMLRRLDRAGIATARVTLHVGAATFQPVRTGRIEDHRMHAEYLEVGEAACEAVRAAREQGGRVIAVGTTTVRSLETAAGSGALQPCRGDSRLFIYPGYRFRVVDGLLTNFHLPGSTLIMLVSALAGRERVLEAYQHAVRQRYRFFSYGDAMLIL